MPLTVSPGVQFREQDFTSAAARRGVTRPVFIGGATKGPLNEPTEIATEQQLISNFGVPLTSDYGLQAAVKYLRKGRQCIFLRVAGDSVRTASARIAGLLGGSTAAKASGSVVFSSGTQPTDEDTVTVDDGDYSVTFEFDDDGSLATATNTSVQIGGDADETAANLQSAIQSSGLDVTAGIDANASDPTVTIEQNLAGSSRNGSISSGGTGTPPTANTFSGGSGPAPANGDIELTGQPADQDTIDINDGDQTIQFEFDDNNSASNSSAILVVIGSDSTETAKNLEAAINDSNLNVTAAFDSDAENPQVDITHNTNDTSGNNSISKSGTNITVSGLDGGEDATSPSARGAVATLEARTPGTWGNNVEVQIRNTRVRNVASTRFDLKVYAPQDPTRDVRSLVEEHVNLSLDSNSDRFIEDVIEGNTSDNAAASEYISVSSVKSGAEVVEGDYVLGTGGGTKGHDGIDYNSTRSENGLVDANGAVVSSAYIGSTSGQTATGMKTLRDPEKVNFNLSAVPGVHHNAVVNEAIDLAKSRGDHLFVVDPPQGLSVDQIIDWHDGQLTGVASVPNPPSSKLDTSYATLNWGWVEIRDDYNKQDLMVPPSGVVMANMAQTDQQAAPWFATAGHKRGRLDAIKVEYSPDTDERARLLRDGNAINPIVDFRDGGPTLFGNDTLLRRPSALQQVHVRRLLVFAKDLIQDAVKFLLFDPTDSVSRSRFVDLVNPILEGIAGQRGLEDFRVISDESNNPPSVRNSRQLNGKIMLIPYAATEVIEVTFALFDQGASFPDDND